MLPENNPLQLIAVKQMSLNLLSNGFVRQKVAVTLVYNTVCHLVECLRQIGRAHALVEPLIRGVIPEVRRFFLKGLSPNQWQCGDCNHEQKWGPELRNRWANR